MANLNTALADNTPGPTGVRPQVRDAGELQPAFLISNNDNNQFGGLPIFMNPVQGNTDTTSTHTGDLGGAAPGV